MQQITADLFIIYYTGQKCGCTNGRDGCDGVAGATGAAGRHGSDGMKGDPGIISPRGSQEPPGPYTRWGRTTCPSTSGTELVYAGRAAGSDSPIKGGESDILCMPHDPECGDYAAGVHNMPCAVCCGN